MFPVTIKHFPLLTAATALILGVAVSAHAPRARISLIPVPKITVPTMTGDTIRDVTKELSSDAYEGRGPGTSAWKRWMITHYESRLANPRPFSMACWLISFSVWFRAKRSSSTAGVGLTRNT